MKYIEAVILDWAGTVVDFGSCAPTTIFVEAFKKQYDFDISLEEARVPMGLGKWDHINTLLQTPNIKGRWINQFGKAPAKQDVNKLYETFLPLQKAKVSEHSDLIPGAIDTIKWIKKHDLKIGSCSGYPRIVMNELIVAAQKNGYKPDAMVASDDIRAGSRPYPFMALQNVIELGVKDVKHCIKVDDSSPGIEEGHRAGMWTVALLLSGNEAGFTEQEFLSASDEQLDQARNKANQVFKKVNPHYCIDTIADLPHIIEEIDQRLAKGEKP